MIETYVSGQEAILRLAFQTAIAGEGSFYVGLGVGPIPADRTKTLADVVEVTGPGYERKTVTRVVAGLGWVLADGVITSPALTFANSSLDPLAVWTSGDYAFLTLSPSGLTAPVTLFATTELVVPILLAGGESKQITVSFSLR